MIRAFVLAALCAAALPSAWAAEDAGFCKSMCGSERQECRATARKATGNDDLLERGTVEKNPFANTASHAQGQSEQMRAADQASFHKRQSERYGVCEDKYLRCTRTCSIPAKPAGGA
ncbi:hypothetical protein SRABI118_04075 [Massilia sp. Bi118]|uniref:hypothetical protein n=1 Tax=Massilia sp. Bi118 TaxID=2822346 RepID=UPI001DBADA3D|nr:hypothetical protein [Massilia sp. Bi118]CAH0291060.1 hypothetical protein SRABI118_04075 [Massilia sp. Bi118]